MRNFFLIICFFLAISGYAIAEETITYQPMNSGVEIIFTADGSDWLKMKAIGEADLKFGDRTDIRQATKKATLRAKAELSKFMKERISTKETSEEITKMSSKATANGSGVSEEATRKIVDTTIERIVNQSDAILKGILVLENNVNKNEKYVRVVVGVSRKTQGIADSLSDSFKRKATLNKVTTPSKQEPGNIMRRSKNFENF